MSSSAALSSLQAGEASPWWRAARADTPGCAHCIHFNNAGASLPPRPVLDAQLAWLDAEARVGAYETAARRQAELRRPYAALARLLNCEPDEVAIVSSATSAWSQVFHGIPFAHGNTILTSLAEYGSNFVAFLQAAQRWGVAARVIPETPQGDIDLPALRQLLAAEPAPVLVAISHVPTSSGRVYDAAGVGAAAAAAGVPFLLDACQAAGQMPLDVQQLRCDFLTGTSRKFLRGPRGAGFLFARSPGGPGSKPAARAWQPALVDVAGARWTGQDSYELVPGAQRYEQYEMSFAAKVGLGVAVEYLLAQGPEACWQRTRALAAHARQQLAQRVPGLTLHDRGSQLCGIISFTLAAAGAAEVQAWLASRAPPINVSVSSIGSSRLDFEARQLQDVVRASCSYYNSCSEVEALVAALAELVAQRQAGQAAG